MRKVFVSSTRCELCTTCGLCIGHGLSKQKLFRPKLALPDYTPGADYSPENAVQRRGEDIENYDG